MRDHAQSVKAELGEPPEDLSPPEFLCEALRELTLLMKTHSTSLAPAETLENEFVAVLEQALDPYLEFCESIGICLRDTDRTIFVLNCFLATHRTLAPFDFTSERVTQLFRRIQEYTDILIDAQHRHLLEKSGLRPLLPTLESWESGSEVSFS